MKAQCASGLGGHVELSLRNSPGETARRVLLYQRLIVKFAGCGTIPVVALGQAGRLPHPPLPLGRSGQKPNEAPNAKPQAKPLGVHVFMAARLFVLSAHFVAASSSVSRS